MTVVSALALPLVDPSVQAGSHDLHVEARSTRQLRDVDFELMGKSLFGFPSLLDDLQELRLSLDSLGHGTCQLFEFLGKAIFLAITIVGHLLDAVRKRYLIPASSRAETGSSWVKQIIDFTLVQQEHLDIDPSS